MGNQFSYNLRSLVSRTTLVTTMLALGLLFLCASRTSAAERAPWAPLAPDACGALVVPCGQIEDFNFIARVAPFVFRGGAGAFGEGGGVLVAGTLSLYKTLGFSLRVPFAAARDPGPLTWVSGPPDVAVFWRMSGRMGPGPFGRAWPEDEPYPKVRVAAYDARPARSTALVGFRFRPLWPGVAGLGPHECKATTGGSCLAEAGVYSSVDLRAWRFLLTGHVEAVAAGDASRLQLGGRLALDIGGHGSVVSELLVQTPLGPQAERGSLLVVGGGLRGFRGPHLQAFYSYGTGPHAGHTIGLTLDLPVAILWGALSRLSERIDPFVAGDGYLYSNGCERIGWIGVSDGDRVWDENRKEWVRVGTHLWQRGNSLSFDKAGKLPYGRLCGSAPPTAGCIRRAEGAPPLTAVSIPWPTVVDVSRATDAGDAWLARFARSPDPSKKEMCAALMDAVLKELDDADRAPTRQGGCRVGLAAANALSGESAGQVEPGGELPGVTLGRAIAQYVLCRDKPRVSAVGGLPLPILPKGGGTVGRPSPGAGASAMVRPVNRRGVPYPEITDLKTGKPMAFPQGPLRRVPDEARVAWDWRNDRARYIREWHDRGLDTPPGGWAEYDIHHIRPREFGGDNSFANLTPVRREVHNGVVTPWWNAYEP